MIQNKGSTHPYQIKNKKIAHATARPRNQQSKPDARESPRPRPTQQGQSHSIKSAGTPARARGTASPISPTQEDPFENSHQRPRLSLALALRTCSGGEKIETQEAERADQQTGGKKRLVGTVVVVVVLVVGGGGEKGKVKGSENWRGRGNFILPFYEFMHIHINRKKQEQERQEHLYGSQRGSEKCL